MLIKSYIFKMITLQVELVNINETSMAYFIVCISVRNALHLELTSYRVRQQSIMRH